MTVQQSLDLSLYIRILKYNRISSERIDYLKKEYINYLNNNVEYLSEELTIFLKYLDDQNKKRSKAM